MFRMTLDPSEALKIYLSFSYWDCTRLTTHEAGASSKQNDQQVITSNVAGST
jgi:hypothetical protein